MTGERGHKIGMFFVSLIEKLIGDDGKRKKEKDYEIYHSKFWKALTVFIFLSILGIAIIINVVEYRQGFDDGLGDVLAVSVFYGLSFIALLVSIHFFNFKVVCFKESFKVRKLFIYRSYEYKDITLKCGNVYTKIYCNNRYITKLNYMLENSGHLEKMLNLYRKKQKKDSVKSTVN